MRLNEVNLRTLSQLALAALVVIVSAEIGAAQVRRFQPRSPTVSPYLNLTRFNNGAIPNYYSLVRPQLDQRQINLQEQEIRRRQAGQIAQLTNQVQQGLQPVAATGTGSGFMIQGTRSTFLDTSRFYPPPPGVFRR